tara:strand:+ start:989 stop:1309 length:321 start_codon:yes stop_codon:yes gene_type:complete
MKRFLLFLIFLLFSSTSLLAEFRLEPVNCTIKKKDNCGAYLYNSNTGATYFCNSEKCTEIMPALEEGSFSGEEVKSSGSKKSKIPKKPKIKKKKSKIPKFKKKKSE